MREVDYNVVRGSSFYGCNLRIVRNDLLEPSPTSSMGGVLGTIVLPMTMKQCFEEVHGSQHVEVDMPSYYSIQEAWRLHAAAVIVRGQGQ